MATTLRHTPENPARCPKCGGVFQRYSGTNLMVCENAMDEKPSPYAGWGATTVPVKPTCDQEPMYLIPGGSRD